MNNNDVDKKENLISWIAELWNNFTNAGYEFHCYNWFIPAIFPIFAAIIGILLNWKTPISYYGIVVGFICQILYFGFFTLIVNMAIIYKRNESNKKNNDYVTSFIIALFTIVTYVPLSNNYFLNQKHYNKISILIIALISFIIFILSIMLYSKYCLSFNDNEKQAETLSKNKRKEELSIEENIEQFLNEDINND